MSGGVRVGRFGGVPVIVDLWWVVITTAIAAAMFVRISEGAGSGALVPGIVAVSGSIMVLGSVVVHEVTHALVARRLGIGVVSVSLFLFGGYSELEGEPTRPRDELLVAGSGPIASLGLAGALALASQVVPSAWTGADEVLGLLAVVNLAVALFNLLPGLPLDGGRVLRSAIWQVTSDSDRATAIAAAAGVAIGVAVAASGILAVVVAGSWVWLWNTAVGVFLVRVAMESGRAARPLERPVGAFLAGGVPTATRSEPADVVASRLADGVGHRRVAVIGSGRVVGVVDRATLEAAGGAVVGDVMQLLEPDDIVDAGESVGSIIERLGASGRTAIVVRNGRTVGILVPSEMARELGRAV